MKSKRIFALLFGLSTIGLGQIPDPCQVGKNAAKLSISNGSIYFPRLIIKSSLTLRKLVEFEYGIKDEVYDGGSDLQFAGEAECFFRSMKNEIDERWGKNFLKDQRKIANTLDKEGFGYIEPRENGIADTLARNLKSEYYLDLIGKSYLVKIKISPNKNIVDVEVLSGLPYATEISHDLNDYRFIKEAVSKVNRVYEPGRLRGKPIESILIFWIEL